MLNKKILLSVLIIGTIAVVAGAGTWAYFDSEQTVEGNTIGSGTLTLIPAGESALTAFTIENIVPGDSGTASAANLENSGSVPGHLYAEITATGEENMPDLAVTMNGEAVTDGATIDLGVLAAGATIPVNVAYDFEYLDEDQNAQQDQTVSYTINYHLMQILPDGTGDDDQNDDDQGEDEQ